MKLHDMFTDAAFRFTAGFVVCSMAVNAVALILIAAIPAAAKAQDGMFRLANKPAAILDGESCHITGVVLLDDASGAWGRGVYQVVPNAVVTLRNRKTKARYRARTGADGFYTITVPSEGLDYEELWPGQVNNPVAHCATPTIQVGALEEVKP